MMRPIVLNVPTELPVGPVLTAAGEGPVGLLWTDATPVDYVTRAGFGEAGAEIGFRIERAVGFGPFALLDQPLANTTTYVDVSAQPGTTYQYRVTAYNASGDAVSNTVTVGPRDVTAPVVSGTVSPAPNAAGWSNGATTVTLTATDPGPEPISGVAFITYSINGGAGVTVPGSTVTLPSTTFPEGTSTITFFASDSAATPNVSASQTLTVQLDSTLPTLTFGAKSPLANAAGWNNTTVSIPYTTADNLSGVATSTPASLLSFTAQGANQTQVVTVTDVAGNSAVFTSPAVSIDSIAPTVTATAAPASANRGGGTTTVRVTGNVADLIPGSGLVTPGTWRLTDSKSTAVVTGNYTPNAAGAYTIQRNISRNNNGNTVRVYTFTVTAADNAGNTSTATTTFTVR